MDRKLAKTVKHNLCELENSKQDMKAIFDIMFSLSDNIIAEENDGYRIKKYTFSEVKERIEKVSAVLNQKYGAKGEFIGIEMENCTDWIVAFWSVLRSGNKPYLINLRHSSRLAEGLIESLSINTVLCVEKGKFNVNYLTVKNLENEYSGEKFEGDFADEIAISTSATTLNQVVCYYSGRQIAEQLLNSGDIVKNCPHIAATYKGNLKQLAFLPFYHIFGLSAVYFWFSFFGATMVFLPNMAPETIKKTCCKHKVTHIFAVPMFWHSVEENILNEISKLSEKEQKTFKKVTKFTTKLQNIFPVMGQKITLKLLDRVTSVLFGPTIRFCISGGSYIRSSTLELLNSIGCSLHNGYGMSEVGITSLEQRIKPKYMNKNSIGRPFGAVNYKISKEGTLLISGNSICSGVSVGGKYTKMEDWFDSRDVVECIDGDYYIKGRMGDVVIGENGENINPDNIEKEILPHNSIRHSVLGLPKNEGEELSIVVQLPKNITKPQIDQMINSVYKLNEKLPITSSIKAFYLTFDDIIPPNAIKVGRSYLKKIINEEKIELIPFANAKAPEFEGEEYTSAHAEKVRGIIAEILNIPIEDIQNDSHILFQLGGTSLQYFSVVVKVEEEFKIHGLLGSEECCYTVNELCKFIERHS